MQKFLQRMMLLAALVVLPWAMQAQVSLPFTDDFEGTSEWTLVNGTNSNAWMIGTGAANGGSNGLYISSDNTSNAYDNTSQQFSYAVLEFEALTAGEFGYSFDWKANGEGNYDYLRVFVAPSSATITAGTTSPTGSSAYDFREESVPGWISLGGKLNLATSWNTEVGTFNLTAAGTYKLVFCWVNDGSGGNQPPAAIDNLMLRQESCPRPLSAHAFNVGIYTADINWIPNGDESSWLVSYLDAGVQVIDEVTDTVTSLAGLTANTPYTVSVFALCDNGDTSLATVTSFRTACVALDTLPYFQDFEGESTTTSTTVSGFANCWNHLNNGTSYGGYPYIASSSSYNHTVGGTKGLYWYGSTTTGTYGDYYCIVLPALDTDIYAINTLQLKVWAKVSSTSYTAPFQIGVMTDPTDITTFQQVGSFTISGNTNWAEYLTSLASFTGAGQYVAIKAVRPTSSWYAYMDDITLETAPICPETYQLATTATGITSAAVAWTTRGGIEDPASYDVTLTDVDAGTTSNYVSNETSYSFAGLTAGTQYKVRVRTNCSTDDGPWDSIMFSTTALPCIELDPETADTVIFSNSTSGTSGCMAYSSYGNTAYQTIYTAAELIAAGLQPGPITGIDLGFTACSSYNKEFTIFMGNSSVTSITSATLASVANHQQVYGPEVHPMNTSGWQHYEFETPFVWDGSSSIMMTTFMNQYGSSQTSSSNLTGYYVSATNKAAYRYQDSNPFTAANINVGNAGSYYSYRASIHFYTGECQTYATCVAPGVMVDDVDATTATVSWVPGYQETSWDVDYRPAAGGAWQNAETGTSLTSATISELSPNTEYEVRVGSLCSDTTVYAIVTFRTACGAMTVLPFTETFESQPTGSSTTGSPFASCWHRLNNGTSSGGYPYVSSSSSYNHTVGGSKGLYWYGSTTTGTYGDYHCAVLPAVDTDVYAMDELQIRFWAKSSSTSYIPVFYVGILSDPEDVTTFQPVDTITINGNTAWAEYEVSFAGFEGTGAYAAIMGIRTTSTWYAYVDDITLEEQPACPHVDNLAYNFTADGVEVTWTEMGDATAWQVYASADATTIAGIDEDYVIDSYEESYVFDTLQNGITYYIYVRPDCSPDAGPWFGPIMVTPGSVNMPVTGTQSITGCGITVYDDGGAMGNYSNSANGTMIVYPAQDSLLRFYGSYYTESTSLDYLKIYEGVGTSGTILFDQQVAGTTQGTIDTITCMSGPITITFHSDGSVVYSGFEIHTFCVPAPECGDVTGVTVQVGPNSALVSWTPGYIGEYNGATVEYREADPAATWSAVGTTANTFIGITGLDTLTTYEVRVQANCTAGDAQWVVAEFTTPNYPCAVMDSTSMIQDTLGNDAGTSSYFPAYSTYNYSVSQQIYRASEFDTSSMGGVITKIGFQLSTTPVNRDWRIYVSTTTANDVASAFIPVSTSDLVWTGNTADLNGSGWNEIILPTPISLSGDNILVTFEDFTGSWSSGNYGMVTTTSTTGISRYTYQDGSPYDPTAVITYSSYASADRLNMYFAGGACLQQETCPAPIVMAEGTDVDEVTLNWVPGNTETSWNVYYRAAADSVYTLAGTATAATYTVSNLAASSQYFFKVASICGTQEGGAAEVNAWTSCGLTPIPFFEDFENEPYGVFSRPCWVAGTTGLGTSYPYPYVISLQGDPSKLVLIYNGGYLVLPEFNAQLNTLQLRFTFVQGADNVRLMLGLLDNLNDPISAVHPIDTLTRYNYDTVNSIINLTYPLDFLPDSAHGHIVFYDAWSDNYSFIDNLYVELIPNCTSATGVTVSNVTSSAADVAWENGCTLATGYLVEYGPRSFALGTGTTIYTTSNSATITGLGAGLSYDVYVYTICGTDTAVASNVAHFATECDVVTLPYTQNFDNVLDPGSSAKVLPNCWSFTMLSTGTYAGQSYYPTAYYTSTAGYTSSGSYCLWLYGNALTVLPEMPTTVDSLMISFHEYNGSPSYYGLIIGAVDSITPGFQASFVGIDTIQYGSAYEYNRHFFLNSYQGTGRYIAFKNYYIGGSYDYSYHYIDDIVVEHVPSCIYPMNFYVAAASTTTADIAWNTSNASDYEYEYGPTGFTRGTGTTGFCTGQLAQITGLTISSTYDIYVRGICGVGDSSDWKMFTFSTLNADPATMPYDCDFTDTTLTNCGFEFVNNTTNKWYMGNAVSNLNANSIYISNDNGVSNSYTNTTTQFSYAYRIINIPAGEVAFSFDWRANGESNYDYLRAWLAPVSAEFVAGTSPDGGTSAYSYNSSNPAGWYPLDGGSKLNLSSTWTTRSGEVTVPAGTYKLVFMWANDGSGGTAPAGAIDNISLAMNTCPKPTNIHAVSAGTDELVVDWTDVSTPVSWIVRYSNVGGTTATEVAATAHPVTITGLTALTPYNVSVRPICSNADTGMWSAPIVLTTAMCDNAAFVTNYDSTQTSTTSSNVPIGNSYYDYGYVQTIVDSARLAELTGDIAAIAFNPVNGTSGDEYNHMNVYFSLISESTLTGFIVPDSTHEFVQVIHDADFSYSNGGWQLFGLDTNFAWDGQSNLLISVQRNNGYYSDGATFYAHNTTGNKTCYNYRDDTPYSITSPGSGTLASYTGDIQLVSCGGASCRKPVVANVTGDYASATLTWTHNSATDFEVSYKATTSSTWSVEVPVTAYNYTFTGLTPQTTYQLRVRAICDEATTSDWAMIEFTTDELPCFAPTNFTAANVGFTTANFTWTPGTSETMWAIHVWNTTYDSTYRVAGQPAGAANGLLSNVTYNAAVRALCGANGEVASEDWSDTISFTTNICDPVTNVANTVTANTATITWTPGANNNGNWEVRYGLVGFVQGDEIATIPATTNTVTINGLESYMTYDAYVRAICEAGANSAWSTKTSFYIDATGIHTVDGEGTVSIYPNPATGNTTISLAGVAGNVNLTIVDMNGRTVRTEQMECDGTCVKVVDVEGLASGAYFVRVSSDSYNTVKKLIVK